MLLTLDKISTIIRSKSEGVHVLEQSIECPEYMYLHKYAGTTAYADMLLNNMSWVEVYAEPHIPEDFEVYVRDRLMRSYTALDPLVEYWYDGLNKAVVIYVGKDK
jgi:hypothetical protein